MTIVCLGWGSLIDEPGDLPVVRGWHRDGPSLPLEFARESANGRMTLVVVEHDRPVPVLWAKLDVPDLSTAHAALHKREGAKRNEAIGTWPALYGRSPHSDEIEGWADRKGFAGVVWTALKAGMRVDRDARLYGTPDWETIERHVDGLDADARERAARYLRIAPAQIVTPYRSALERLLLG